MIWLWRKEHMLRLRAGREFEWQVRVSYAVFRPELKPNPFEKSKVRNWYKLPLRSQISRGTMSKNW